MGDVNKSGEGVAHHSSEGSSKDQVYSPSLHAEIILLSDKEWMEAVKPAIPDRITTRTCSSYEQFLSDLSGKVAVAVLDATLAEEKLRKAVARTVSESAHARIALVATDGAQLLRCEAPRDESFVFPEKRDSFDSLIKRLYVRSYYSATIERYYKVRFSIRNREIQLSTEERDADERIQRLENAAKVLQSHLELFRNVLKQEDFEAMQDRPDRLETLAARSKNSSSPEAVGLPESCPKCELDWTSWHGSRLRNGYERIGANTWRCTGCGTIMADNDPDNYRLA
jgi:hypothetical protein